MKTRRCSLIVLTVLCAFASLDCCPQVQSQGQDELLETHERGGLPNFYAKLKRGPEVRIAYLGGSITAQAGWRPKSLAWFQQQHPQATLSEINAAIGGTGSDLGVFRLRLDVLEHHPDLLFVEFAVNDGGASVEQIHRCMEGIIRQTWRHEATTDICFVSEHSLAPPGSIEQSFGQKFREIPARVVDCRRRGGLPRFPFSGHGGAFLRPDGAGLRPIERAGG